MDVSYLLPRLLPHVWLEADSRLEWRRPASDHVYVIDSGDAYKVGRSADPKKRVRELQTSHHRELSVVRARRCPPWGEQVLHEALQHLHIRGEWFARDPSVLRIFDEARFGYPAELIGKWVKEMRAEHVQWVEGMTKMHALEPRMGRTFCNAQRYEESGQRLPRCRRCLRHVRVTLWRMKPFVRWASEIAEC